MASPFGDARMRRLAAFALALALIAACGGPRETAVGNAPVIIISVDTLRADRLPAYGYRGVETPNIDRLRVDSILYTNAFASVPLTLPSHATILTGLNPPEHGVRNNIGYQLRADVPTLPAQLKGAGYVTGAAVSAFVLRGSTGIARSFDFYDDSILSRPNIPIGVLQRPGAETVRVANEWVGAQKGKPFFFLLHLFEPHSPYEPPEPFRSRFRGYEGEIAHADAIVGQFLDQLRASGVYDDALIIFLSDHGEGLGDHGEPEHGIFLYREAIRVPLMIKLPGTKRRGESDDRLAGLVDVFATVAAVTGTPPPAKTAGRSLLGDAAAPARTIYSESLYPRIHLGWSELRSLVDGRHHYIEAPKPELYDMAADPAEKRNILNDERRVYSRLRGAMSSFNTTVEMPERIDPEEAKKLAALGYLGSAAPSASGPLPDPKDRIGEISMMVAASRHAREGNHAAAVDLLRQILTANPRLVDGWNQLGTSLEALDRHQEAIDAYKRAIEASPELGAEFGLRLGALYLTMERFDEAVGHARLSEKTNPGGAHLLMARIALARKDFATAEKEATLASRDEQHGPAARVLLAQTVAQQGRAAEALSIVDEVARDAAARKLGSIESLEFVRGDALARMERYDEAIAAFQRSIATFPQERQAYGSLYVVYLLTGREADAEKTLELFVRVNPNRRAYAYAAKTVEAVGDTRGAAEWRRRAAQVR